MRSHRTLVGTVVVALAVLVSTSAPARGAVVSTTAATPAAPGAAGNAVTAWNEIAVTTLIALPGPSGGAPSAAPIHLAMAQGAVYDAVNAIGHRYYRPYLLEDRFPPCASKDAAAATAAYDVLRYLLSTVPGIDADRDTRLAMLDAQYETFLADVPTSWCTEQGIAAGDAAAQAMIASRLDDGRFGPSQWTPNPAPGHWQPLLDASNAPILDPTPWVGGVTPFLLGSSSQFRSRGPNDLRSKRWAREFNEVKALGAADSSVRTEHQTYVARWWQSTPTASWNDVARQLVARAGLGVTRTSRLLAMQDLSAADAAINCWNDKYHFDFWRPWNAIPHADLDGNPATTADPDWTPLITAPYPEHPSGHLCLDGANTTALRMFFGNRIRGGFQITSASTLLQPEPADPRMRTFGSFSQALREIVVARIWAGLHFRTADLQGKALGEHVARFAAAHYFEPVGHHHH